MAPSQPADRSFDPTGHYPDAASKAAAFLRTLAHEGRLRIMCALLDGPMTVGDLVVAMQVPQTAVSQQLMRLRGEGFVVASRSGKHVTYRLVRDDIRSVIASLREAFCPR